MAHWYEISKINICQIRHIIKITTLQHCERSFVMRLYENGRR